MTRLILIRHGETDYNLTNKYCGFLDPPLNKTGIRQSKCLHHTLERVAVNKVYSSGLIRSYETSQIIFKRNKIERLPDFREMNFGLFEGLTYDEVIERYPLLYQDWINNPARVKIPNGENLTDLDKRVNKRLFSILSEHKGSVIAIVTHSGPIRVILCNILERGNLKKFWQIEQGLCALNIIDYSELSLPRIIKINDVSHLSRQDIRQ